MDESLPEGDLDLGLAAAFRERSSSQPRPRDSIVPPAARVLLRDTASEPAPEVRPRIAGREGCYEVLGEIARGAVGVVFRCHDVDLGRAVAIKVIRVEHLDNAGVVQRFVEEAQVGGQLQHPGIVPVYEMGLRSDGRTPWFAMKLVKGRTLSALLAERTSPSDKRRHFLGVFERICQTLAYAHSRGVVHRDLKPANVMVGAFGEVQVVDWGFAKVLRLETESASIVPETADRSVISTVRSGSTDSRSVVGSVFGTPAYMPPEQARGTVDDVDERSDVFALGAILCEILTGRPPYVAESDRLLTMAARADLDAAFARLAACGADPAIVDVCRSCLVAAREARPRNGTDVAARVAQHLASEEEKTRAAQLAAVESRAAATQAGIEAETAQERVRHARRQKRLTAAVAGVLLVALVVIGGVFVLFDRDRAERSAEISRDVEAAVAQSVFLRGRALGRADAAAAHDAIDAAERAARLAETRDVGEEVRRQTSKSLEETQAESLRARKVATLLLRATRVNYMWGSGYSGKGVKKEDTLRKAIALYPDCAEAHRRLAQDLGATIQNPDGSACDDWRDHVTEIDAEFRKAVELDPDSPTARSSLADFIRSESPASDELAVHEEALIRLEPLEPSWRVKSFERHVHRGEFDEAARVARELADLDLDETPLESRLANVREAVAAADGILRGEAVPDVWAAKPWDLVEACLFARRYATLARLSTAPKLGLVQTNQAPMSGLAALRVAELRAGLGEGSDARGVSDEERAQFRRLSLEGYRALLSGVTGSVPAADEGRPWSAQVLIGEKDGGSWPDSPGAMVRTVLMAKLSQEEQADWRDAFSGYDRFGRQNYTDRILWSLLVGGSQSGDFTEDIECGLRRHPDDYNLLNMLGVAQFKNGAFDKAIETLTKVEAAYSASPNGPRPSTLAYLAAAYFRRGGADEARAALERCRAVAAKPLYARNAEAQGYVSMAESLLAGEDARDADGRK